MKIAIASVTAIVYLWVGCGFADYRVFDHGIWPKSWPQELESLRKQSSTIQGGQLELLTYQ